MATLHTVLVNIARSDTAGLSYPAGIQQSNWLRWRQWLVFFAMGGLVIAIEIRNHAHMWMEHQSGQTILTDHELLWELFLFGLLLPILAGITLEHMVGTAVERDRMARDLEVRRALVGQMQKTQNWAELVDLVVTAPGLVTMAARSWLFAQRSSEEEFEHIAHWERHEGVIPSASSLVSPAICERCVGPTSLNGSRVLNCNHPDPGSSDHNFTRYCLWLSPAGMRKAALLFDLPADHPLEPGQAKALDDLGDQMSMAIDNANLRYQEKRQIDLARKERLRIARDLHDTLGQNVSYLRLKLEQLSDARLAPNRAEIQNDLAKMLAVADEAYEQMRDALEELRASEYPGLEEAVRQYAAQVGTRGGFAVRVHSSGMASTLSPRQTRQLMYIVREALNNVEKHAGALNVDIHLQWSDGIFRLVVRDDGQGFHLDEFKREDSYGLAIMEERSRAINANLTIQSVPGEGTELAVSLLLASNALPQTVTQ